MVEKAALERVPSYEEKGGALLKQMVKLDEDYQNERVPWEIDVLVQNERLQRRKLHWIDCDYASALSEDEVSCDHWRPF